MIKTIRNSKTSKVIACYLALMLILEIIAPVQAFALTGGPSQPEFESFTPIGTSDMVDLSSGDFNYNIPIMDVGGYPINLAYNSGITMDQEASWVGLGWDLSVGQITRQMRGIPDDFDGDEMIYENNMKDNVTVGADFGVFAAGLGYKESKGLRLSTGFGVKYNNYNGFTFTRTSGLSYAISENLSVGMQMTESASEGVSIAPYASFSLLFKNSDDTKTTIGVNTGISLNSRRGIEEMTMSSSISRAEKPAEKDKEKESQHYQSASIGGSISFTNSSYTPAKRVGMTSSNYMFNLNIEGELWGIEPGAKFSGYRTSQGIKDSEKYKKEKAYGFENTYSATDKDILDFNREKDKSFTPYTTTLPITNNTYDIYSIQGQGVAGMFRPYKSQVGYVYDNNVTDDSHGGNIGVEIGLGALTHWGIDASVTIANSSTKVWRNQNPVINRFEEVKANKPEYEKVFFKNIGGFHVDKEYNLFDTKLGGYDPVNFKIAGSKFARKTDFVYRKKGLGASTVISAPIKRESRLNRSQAIQKLTKLESKKYGYDAQLSKYSKDHHTAEIRVTKEGGERYVYGRAAYNTVKKEVTFDVSGTAPSCKTNLVSYIPGKHNSSKNNANGDQYFSRTTTPAYAHSYLLTSVLSSDYSDITNDGPTDDDLGSYTKFVYDDSKTVSNTYKWRVPYMQNSANFDEGLKTSKADDKGSYTYGEKELLYIKKIETKTHVAIFDISVRKDGYGVDSENGGGSSSTASKMYKLNKITLYSKPEYTALGDEATPIKVAHFVYDYALGAGVINGIKTGVDNNFGQTSLDDNELANQKGKLTLKKIYFTYRNSNMGKYTPYTFNYSPFNPVYNMKAYDTWGGYKTDNTGATCGINDPLSNAEFPYVEQNKTNADQNSSAWLLQSVALPSGGKIELQYESDDYKSVQDKDVMQMFQVAGVGTSPTPVSLAEVTNTTLFTNQSDFKNRLYIKLPEQTSLADFKKKYIGAIQNEEMYFRFLLNMSQPGSGNDDKYDYVTGYLKLKQNDPINEQYSVFNLNGEYYASIPVEMVNKGDGFNSDNNVNPISKAGWQFGRQYLNRYVYTNSTDESTDNLEEIVKEIIGAAPAMFEIFKSPNKQLINRKIASKFIAGKSWVRLMQPKKLKFGGGSRVKEVKMHDQWQVMTNHESDDNYKQYYGQQYSYLGEDGNTSGVATYEPIGNKENPLVQPFYDKNNPGGLLAPDEQNYTEKPLGESFFPSPKITYGRVTVKNLPRTVTTDGNISSQVKKHATGRVITEFYTTADYPTIGDYTDLMSSYDKSDVLSSILNLNVRNHLTLSQGYMIHTNDMDGKVKSERVYAEGQTSPISGADYIYEESASQGTPTYNQNQGRLNNVITTVDSKGVIAPKLVGVDYDVINDFRDSESVTTTGGLSYNTATIPIPFCTLVIPTIIPSFSRHENQIKMAVTTKVIHTSAILREKRVYDSGAMVATKNLAWDAETGEVLLTETINEYKDKYYSFNFPAYWSYDGMKQAAQNLDLEWDLKKSNEDGKYEFATSTYKATDYLTPGDELWITPANTSAQFKAYVTDVDATKFSLITYKGRYVTNAMVNTGHFKIIRSGKRNMSSASMASVTSMTNPLYNGTTALLKLPDNLYASTAWTQSRIVNASAIEYSDTWAAQCECRLPKMKFSGGALVFDYSNTDENTLISYNPYVYNIKGNWRPKVSYAYLTGRNSDASPNPRKNGFFNTFDPMYTYDATLGKWIINPANKLKWTYASEVSQYNPFGFELENKDALGRYSTALYGYNFRFPIAVASNTKYSELAYDGFEDYGFSTCDTTSHFDFNQSLKANKVSISSSQAHSGRKSLKVAPNSKATVKKQIVPCAANN